MNPVHEHGGVSIYWGDALTVLQDFANECVNCVVTSPPYWGLRDYGVEGQLGLEKTPEEYVSRMVEVFREVKRVLRDDGTLWLNVGDSYAATTKGSGGHTEKQDSNVGSFFSDRKWQIPNGLKPKDLVGVPWMLAFALRADGWYLRSDIIWSKPNPMPESVTDRPTKAHEYIFLLAKSERYYYDADAIREKSVTDDLRKPYAPGQIDARGNGHDRGGGELRKVARQMRRSDAEGFGLTRGTGNPSVTHEMGKNKRTVWEVCPDPFPEAHFATFPEELIKPCILSGCPAGGIVLDPFFGSGTTGLVARANNCKAIGIELNQDYIEIAKRRLAQDVLQWA